jgi:hypothetical protein
MIQNEKRILNGEEVDWLAPKPHDSLNNSIDKIVEEVNSHFPPVINEPLTDNQSPQPNYVGTDLQP